MKLRVGVPCVPPRLCLQRGDRVGWHIAFLPPADPGIATSIAGWIARIPVGNPGATRPAAPGGIRHPSRILIGNRTWAPPPPVIGTIRIRTGVPIGHAGIASPLGIGTSASVTVRLKRSGWRLTYCSRNDRRARDTSQKGAAVELALRFQCHCPALWGGPPPRNKRRSAFEP
jgi:hypothetical protein